MNMKVRFDNAARNIELTERIEVLKAELARMRPVFRAAMGVCNGKATMAQLIRVCARAERKGKGKR